MKYWCSRGPLLRNTTKCYLIAFFRKHNIYKHPHYIGTLAIPRKYLYDHPDVHLRYSTAWARRINSLSDIESPTLGGAKRHLKHAATYIRKNNFEVKRLACAPN